jgi:diphthine-ammonia ligase
MEKLKLGVLFSGGKDSTYAAWLAKKQGHELACLITLYSENPDSYMFHTPSIKKTKQQAQIMNLPIIVQKTKGKKEVELKDLENAIKSAKEKYNINAIVSGALASNYQKSRIENICKKLNLKSMTPLWNENEFLYLKKLVNDKFSVIITAVSAYPLNGSWLGRKIDQAFIEDVKKLYEKYKIHPAGEGGEFETFVIDCPLFKSPLEVKGADFTGDGNSWRMELELV